MGTPAISRLTSGAVVLPLASDEEVAGAASVMRQLWPQLTHGAYCARARQLMAGDGYRLLAVTTLGSVRAVTGYRIMNALEGGRVLVVEDFVCDARYRRQGHGSILIRALRDIAAESLCTCMRIAVSHALCEEALGFLLRHGFGAHGAVLHCAIGQDDAREPREDR